ncbi:hypothetical protein FUAX_30010 [Fulvitalea axinellae]|uniref:Uncharacterized protein n=1 Tax=Fulvitalea axinellae TaxID=1182444 RepID=A0AAU9CVP3_9BACT|nr:hypothetical protein FUAX_30010 [Fulvitalea axinellae]
MRMVVFSLLIMIFGLSNIVVGQSDDYWDNYDTTLNLDFNFDSSEVSIPIDDVVTKDYSFTLNGIDCVVTVNYFDQKNVTSIAVDTGDCSVSRVAVQGAYGVYVPPTEFDSYFYVDISDNALWYPTIEVEVYGVKATLYFIDTPLNGIL